MVGPLTRTLSSAAPRRQSNAIQFTLPQYGANVRHGTTSRFAALDIASGVAHSPPRLPLALLLPARLCRASHSQENKTETGCARLNSDTESIRAKTERDELSARSANLVAAGFDTPKLSVDVLKLFVQNTPNLQRPRRTEIHQPPKTATRFGSLSRTVSMQVARS